MTSKPDVAISVGLMLAGPAIIGLGLLALAAGAPGPLVAIIETVGWLGGPALAVIGVARLWSRGQLLWLPVTMPGRMALWMLGGCAGFFMLFILAIATGVGPEETPEFFSNLYLAISLLLSGTFAVAAAAMAAYGVFRRGERSVLVIGCVIFGIVVSVFALGEIGAEGPDRGSQRRSSPTAPVPSNSHTNVSAQSAGHGAVQVSFDYAFHSDPVGWTTDSITVTALGGDSQPLLGHDSDVLPIAQGSGHVDVVMNFSEEQLTQLHGFSICFTGPGTPDPNPACAIIQYSAK